MIQIALGSIAFVSGKESNFKIKDSRVNIFWGGTRDEASKRLIRYATFPENKPSIDVPGIEGVVHWQCKLILEGKYLPDVNYIKEHVHCVPAKKQGVDEISEDVAYLRYRVNEIDIMVTLTERRTYVFLTDTTNKTQGEPQSHIMWNGIFKGMDVVAGGKYVCITYDSEYLSIKGTGGLPSRIRKPDEWFLWLKRRHEKKPDPPAEVPQDASPFAP
jgi:hypothetical protein